MIRSFVKETGEYKKMPRKVFNIGRRKQFCFHLVVFVQKYFGFMRVVSHFTFDLFSKRSLLGSLLAS